MRGRVKPVRRNQAVKPIISVINIDRRSVNRLTDAQPLPGMGNRVIKLGVFLRLAVVFPMGDRVDLSKSDNNICLHH